MSPVFTGGERTMFYALFMLLAMLIALALVWFSQFKISQEKVATID